MSVLVDRLLAIHAALGEQQLPHAFGGAIALAYCTEEPRGTIDLDVNVFIAHDQFETVLDALPDAIKVTAGNKHDLVETGQARLWWDSTPIDLFLNTHPFHAIAASRVRRVPLAGTQIPVLDCTSLAVFKVFFNRTKDWADLEAMAEAGQLDVTAVAAFVRNLLGDDPRLGRLAALET